MICIKAIVYGKVQGVFYREGTRKKAVSLNIAGWVKNNADGTVELQACGEKDDIEKFTKWLRKGPLLARVSNVVWSEIPVESFQEFAVLR